MVDITFIQQIPIVVEAFILTGVVNLLEWLTMSMVLVIDTMTFLEGHILHEVIFVFLFLFL